MADIGHTDYEYDGGNGSGDHDAPETPYESKIRIGDAEECYGNTTLDEDGAGGVEEFGDEKELLVMVRLAMSDFQSTRAGGRIRTLVPDTISLAFRAAASWPDP